MIPKKKWMKCSHGSKSLTRGYTYLIEERGRKVKVEACRETGRRIGVTAKRDRFRDIKPSQHRQKQEQKRSAF